ncbi:BglG family transcription antiterminator [Alkalibacter saccharofermentans]|uniref:Transcriptional antiterminator n=1 Tax=Alkalibacter saccharofermentans DSM 14828 TaxID=1120975 RepID=A0A1M4UXL7_9FIRM|nr:BglG family transcription antiterminator [Alkalibacter saccharofermentans]SHE61491.1 Transcriptional antiterminator [Alkalibacter saccharofermentans DSM 14828]
MESNKNLNFEILNMLLDAKTPITTKKLAWETGKSSRTIRTHIKTISEVLESEGFLLVKKPNVGIYIEATNKERQQIKTKYKQLMTQNEDYDSDFRKNYILEILLINKFSYTMQMFADELYCSKSTIANDFDVVDEWLKSRGLKLIRNKSRGFWIEGAEIDFRKVIVDFLSKNCNSQYQKDDFENNISDYRLGMVNSMRLKEFFPEIELAEVERLVKLAEKQLGTIFTEQAFINLITHIAIIIRRVKENREITMTKDFNEKFKGSDIYPVAKKLVEGLESAFTVIMPEDEICYICLHLLGSKIYEELTEDNCKMILGSQEEFLLKIADEIINLTGIILNVDLNVDDFLRTSLVLHLRPVIVRLENDLRLENPMLETIKSEYGEIFCASWVCGTIFEKECGLQINEDEIAYIAMHIAAAVDRKKCHVKTIIVCSSGIGTAQWLKSKLANQFANMEITRVLSVEKLTKELIDSCDLIISTIPFKKHSPKVVKISTLVTTEDVAKINRAIGEIKSKKPIQEETNTRSYSDLDLITENYCFIEKELTKYEDVIEKYGNRLIEDAYAKDGFVESVLNRENASSTYLGKGIAIPHPTIEYVRNSKIAVIKLDKPIINKYEVIEMIFLLCLKIEGYGIATKIFSEFYSMLGNEKYMNDLKQVESTEQMNTMLRRFNYGENIQ